MNKKLMSLVVCLALVAPVGRLSAGLVLHWKLDDGAGKTAMDSSGNGRDGTIGGTAQWVKGMVGGALQFDGKTNYIAMENLNISGTLSIALWIMPTGVPYTTGYQAIFHDDVWTWGSIQGHLRAETSFVNLDVYGGGAVTSTTALQPNTWYHIVGTFAASGMTGDSKLYINSVLENTNKGVTGAVFLGPVNFGAWNEGSRFFSGVMDDVRVYDSVVLAEEIPAIMLGDRPKELASGPIPEDRSADVPRDEVLSWTPGQYAATHDVYFGTDYNDVNNAVATSPLLVSMGQAATTYQPTSLFDFGQAYYWRVDEVNAPSKPGLFQGSTWSFKAETYGLAVTTPIKATASSQSSTLTGPGKTIDRSGLDTLDQHSIEVEHMWLSKSRETPVWIQYEFDQVYSLYQMWVWNQNQLTELDDGNGAMDVTIETSTDGTFWTVLANVPQFAQAIAEETYVHNTTVDFGGARAKFVRLNILSNWGNATQSGLAEVRFFYVPLKAFGPTPAVGDTGVGVDSLLNWRPGRTAASHEVYFGADQSALSKVGTVTGHTYSLVSAGAEYEKTYYWKVDEVNGTDTWPGDVWSFSTQGYGVVDDFESYNDQCNRVYYAWRSGAGNSENADCGQSAYGGNGTGSIVGNDNPPYAERTEANVHSGSQAMPFFYDNTAGNTTSEATRTFDSAQDWTMGGAKTLVLFFKGDAANGAGQVYVKINGTQVSYNGGADSLTTGLWNQWNLDLSSLSVKAVSSLTIGISGTGKGVLYIDDIRLYRVAPQVP